jgi:hypothetical protein
MLRFFAKAHTHFMAKLKECCANVNDGNPKAQSKFAKQVDGFPFVLTTQLEPGKRGRYVLHIFYVGSYDPISKTLIMQDDVIPDKPWLSLNVLRLHSKGRGEYEHKHYTALLVTHHALSRLTQRCGARNMADLLNAATGICDTYLGKVMDDKQFSDFPDGTRLPFKDGTAVLNHDQDLDGAPVVVTVF